MTKPRKALSSLFARTEPVEIPHKTESRKVEKEVPSKKPSKPTPTPQRPTFAPKAVQVETPATVEETEVTVAVNDVVATKSEWVAAEPELTVSMETPEPVLEIPEIVTPTIEMASPEATPATVEAVPVEAASMASTPVDLVPTASTPIEGTVGTSEIQTVTENNAVAQIEHHNNVTNAVLNIQYNFELQRSERMNWRQDEYVEFIRRIDVAQAEAFFLKGKLLSEAKDRFFQENKVGWKTFAETILGMNYTTANQYIRVSQEFDVTSHRRPDFGFEHYKALLPLDLESRTKLLGELSQVSVKELRNLVQKTLQEKQGVSTKSQRSTHSKAMLEILLNLKGKMFDCSPDSMTQQERWQLTAACRNLAEELEEMAQQLGGYRERRPTPVPVVEHNEIEA